MTKNVIKEMAAPLGEYNSYNTTTITITTILKMLRYVLLC